MWVYAVTRMTIYADPQLEALMSKQAAVMEDEAAQVSRLEGLSSSTQASRGFACLSHVYMGACGVYMGVVRVVYMWM